MKKHISLRPIAKKACQHSYSPYSSIKVGAAVLCGTKVFSGTNVENISFGATVCAERTAILKAVSEGAKKIDKLYLYTDSLWAPCGMCLQVMSEFMDAESEVILGSKDKEVSLKLKDLLPKHTDLETFNKLKNK